MRFVTICSGGIMKCPNVCPLCGSNNVICATQGLICKIADTFFRN